MRRCRRSGGRSSGSPTAWCASLSASRMSRTSRTISARRSTPSRTRPAHMSELIDLILHVDVYLLELIATYGVWIYAILFLIVFAETGLVVTPFLPGDSLLFAAGALAASGALDVRIVLLLVTTAAIAGDAVNYAIG